MPVRNRWAAGSAAALLLALSAEAGGFEVTLTATEPAGMARTFEVVSVGLPLPPGAVRDVAVLRLLNEAGREVAADFRPLAYYPGGEKSIRWVKATFAVTLPANGRAVLRLRDDGPGRAAARSRHEWRVMRTGQGTVVVTGGARFAINRQFALFTQAWIDVDGNGKIEASERIIEGSLNHGGVARDREGRRYTSAFQVQDLEVLEESALHCVVRVGGTHGSSEPGAYKRGLCEYEAYFTFVRERPWARVDYILKNSPREPRGEPVIGDYSLVTRMELQGTVTGKVLAERLHELTLTSGQAAVLHQDSDGTERWKEPAAAPAVSPGGEQFQGFRLSVGPVTRETVSASGLQARGFVELGDEKWGMMAGLADFWQTYPKAVEIDGSGRVVFHLLPEQAKRPQWLDDQGHAGHRLVYALVGKRDPAGRLSLEEFAKLASNPVVVTAPPEYLGRCGALHDLGPYVTGEAGAPMGAADPAGVAADRARDREYGWGVFGASWSKLTGWSAAAPGGYHPLRDADTLFRYAATGDRRWFDLGVNRARHWRDNRAYHQDGVDVFAPYKDFAEARAALPVGGARRAFTPDGEAAPFMAGKPAAGRSRWPLPDEANLSLDEVYNLYLLTGDWKAREAAAEAAAAARAYLALVPDRDLRPGMAAAMCLRALAKYHHLAAPAEGRSAAELAAAGRRLKAVLAPGRAAARADQPDQPVGAAESGAFLRAVAMAYAITGDDDLLDLALGTGDWLTEFAATPAGFGTTPVPGNELKPQAQRTNPDDRPDDPHRGMGTALCLEPLAWLYTQTGDGRYLAAGRAAEPLIGEAARRAWASVLPFYYHVARNLDRVDTVPPAAVTDLAAQVQDDAVTLTWTASGDNAREGTAQRVQVKCAARPICEIVKLPDQEKTHATWWSAANVPDEPKPAAAGAPQTMKVTGLKPGTWYFAVKTWDEAPNASALSNVVQVEVK